MPEAEAYKINNRQSLFSRVEDFVPLIDIVGPNLSDSPAILHQAMCW